jgi:hypothetical protein
MSQGTHVVLLTSSVTMTDSDAASVDGFGDDKLSSVRIDPVRFEDTPTHLQDVSGAKKITIVEQPMNSDRKDMSHPSTRASTPDEPESRPRHPTPLPPPPGNGHPTINHGLEGRPPTPPPPPREYRNQISEYSDGSSADSESSDDDNSSLRSNSDNSSATNTRLRQARAAARAATRAATRAERFRNLRRTPPPPSDSSSDDDSDSQPERSVTHPLDGDVRKSIDQASNQPKSPRVGISEGPRKAGVAFIESARDSHSSEHTLKLDSKQEEYRRPPPPPPIPPEYLKSPETDISQSGEESAMPDSVLINPIPSRPPVAFQVEEGELRPPPPPIPAEFRKVSTSDLRVTFPGGASPPSPPMTSQSGRTLPSDIDVPELSQGLAISREDPEHAKIEKHNENRQSPNGSLLQNLQVQPRSALKKAGFRKKPRSAVPEVELTRDDVVITRTKIPPRKTVSFHEPSGIGGLAEGLDSRESRRYRRYLSDAQFSRKELEKARNEIEIERRKHASSIFRLVENLKEILKLSDLDDVLDTIKDTKNETESVAESKDSDDHHSSPSLPLEEPKTLSMFKTLAKSIIEEQSVYQNVADRLSTQEQNLNALDNLLRQKETYALEKILAPLNGEDNDSDDESSDCESESSGAPSVRSADSAVTASTVREYYDKLGDINLCRDYIHNLDIDHIMFSRSRQQRRSAGEFLDPPDHIFYQDYYEERKKLITEYKITKSRIFDLYETCVQKERRIEEPNLPPQDPSDDPKVDPSLFVRAWSTFHMLERSDDGEEDDGNSMVSVLRALVDRPIIRAQTMILQWVRECDKSREDEDMAEHSAGQPDIDDDEKDSVDYTPGWADIDDSILEKYDPHDPEQKADRLFGLPLTIRRRASEPDFRLEAIDESYRNREAGRKRSLSMNRLDSRYSENFVH